MVECLSKKLITKKYHRKRQRVLRNSECSAESSGSSAAVSPCSAVSASSAAFVSSASPAVSEESVSSISSVTVSLAFVSVPLSPRSDFTGIGAFSFFSLFSLKSRGLISTATSAAANTGVSVSFFFACDASFSSSQSAKPVSSRSSPCFSSSVIQGLLSANNAIVSVAFSTKSLAFATAAGRLVSSFARESHSSPVDCSPLFFASNAAAVDSAPSMYSQSSASDSSWANLSR
mmetsp:Transcript_11581/g.42886  ORF Transcript_11581/g.42886 Transcript_11581/m.42886 type:complete len:232 (-) Transcript_11581:2345-3040(-)